MRCITLRKGEYITVQFNRLNSERVHLSFDTAREVTILRGKVLWCLDGVNDT